MNIEKLKKACQLMHKTGADDTQYILIRLRDVEELISAWERDAILREWIESVMNTFEEVDIGNDENPEEEENSGEGPDQSESERDSEGSENGEMGHDGIGQKGCAQERSEQADIL